MMIKTIIRQLLPQVVIDTVREIRKKQQHEKTLNEWKGKGCPAPPPHLVKQIIIKEYHEKYRYPILVETGTYLGDMVEAQKKRFSKIFSIELGFDLYRKAVERFKHDENVVIVQGDSGKILKDVLVQIKEPAIFWLDGHYSSGITAKGDKECPIFEELDAIFDSKKLDHILLIDDARCFNGEGDYPTIEELAAYIKTKNENYQVEVKYDVIRCVV